MTDGFLWWGHFVFLTLVWVAIIVHGELDCRMILLFIFGCFHGAGLEKGLRIVYFRITRNGVLFLYITFDILAPCVRPPTAPTRQFSPHYGEDEDPC